MKEIYTLPFGRWRESERVFLCLLFFSGFQLRRILLPKWHNFRVAYFDLIDHTRENHINVTEVGKIFTRSQPQRALVNSQRIKHECNDYGKTFIGTLPKRALTHEQPYKSYKFRMLSA